jgi:ATP-dependent Zn protease
LLGRHQRLFWTTTARRRRLSRIPKQQDSSEATAKFIDDEIKRLLDEVKKRDRDLMKEHEHGLERPAETLLEEKP